MIKPFCLGVLALCVSMICSITIADDDQHADYFKAFYALQATPSGATAIPPCTVAQKKQLLNLFQQNNINDLGGGQKLVSIDSTGMFVDNYSESVEAYQGDFSNDGSKEFLLITTGGSMATNTISAVFKLVKQKLIRVDFGTVLQKNLNVQDSSQFYLYTAKPFAIIQNNKTYIRFMSIPQDYDKTGLLLCTYFWQTDKISLIGPDTCVGGKNANPNT